VTKRIKTYEFSFESVLRASFVVRRSAVRATQASSSGKLTSLYMPSSSSLKAWLTIERSVRGKCVIVSYLIHDFLLSCSIRKQALHQFALTFGMLKVQLGPFEFDGFLLTLSAQQDMAETWHTSLKSETSFFKDSCSFS
jgi:hypothetical protein